MISCGMGILSVLLRFTLFTIYTVLFDWYPGKQLRTSISLWQEILEIPVEQQSRSPYGTHLERLRIRLELTIGWTFTDLEC